MTAERIALFLPSLRGGGAEEVMVALANAFVSRNLAVDLVVMAAIGPNMKRVRAGVRLVDLHAGGAARAIGPLMRYLLSARPQVMLSTQGHANLVAVVARALAAPAMRLVVREPTTPSSLLAHAKHNRKQRLVQRVLPYAYRGADAVVAPSRGVAEDLCSAHSALRRVVSVIPNPIDVAALEALAEEEVEHPWYAPGADPVIVAVGRLSVEKDLPTLLRGFALVCRERDARLLILGEGDQRGALEALVRELGLGECVQLPGFVDNPFKYLRRAALYVLSSRLEGLPNTLLQATALGVPVVATDCASGPREILEGGRFGGLVPVGDHAALGRAILQALAEPPSPMPRAIFEARYGAEGSVAEYLRVCRLRYQGGRPSLGRNP